MSNNNNNNNNNDNNNNNQQKRAHDFPITADDRVKLKGSIKKDKYLDVAWKFKKMWNMKVTVIPIVMVTLGRITKGFVQVLEDLEIRERVDTIQTTALSWSAIILREFGKI